MEPEWTIEVALNDEENRDRNVTPLRPWPWIEATGAEVGGTISLEMSDWRVSGHGDVVSIEPCPNVETPGPGTNLVTGEFVTADAEVVELWIDGLDEPIRATPSHPFWSLDREGWVGAGELLPGERLRSRDGTAVVARVDVRAGFEAVCNLEVWDDHTFFVSAARLWVHNQCAAWPPGRLSGKQVVAFLKTQGFEVVRIRGSHHILRHGGTGLQVTVPVHGNRALGKGLLNKIKKEAGW